MKRLRLLCWSILIAWPFLLMAKNVVEREVVVLDIAGAIGPATGDYLHRGLRRAAEMDAALVVLRVDTPGGLDSAMRRIVQDILASTVPVATYVAPSGARAASAGTYILLASHVAAMAPATNLGAATPVQLGGESQSPRSGDDKKENPSAKPGMDEKMMNDSIAYIRGLAQMRGRNAQWAERAVREAASLQSHEAVRLHVADFIATDLNDLLKQAHGRVVKLGERDVTLATAGLATVVIEPDWRSRLLSVITDPNVSYILMLLGIYGLFFELWNPGYVLPGVVGGICLLLALYAFQVLPISYAGVGLILLGIAFMVAEAFLPSFGALGIGGVVAFVVGSIILFDADVEGYAVAWQLIAGVAAASLAFFLGMVMFAVKARRRKVVSGAEELIGAAADVLDDFDVKGRVRVRGEEWQARTASPLRRGERVKITARDGLVLTVKPDNNLE